MTLFQEGSGFFKREGRNVDGEEEKKGKGAPTLN